MVYDTAEELAAQNLRSLPTLHHRIRETLEHVLASGCLLDGDLQVPIFSAPPADGPRVPTLPTAKARLDW